MDEKIAKAGKDVLVEIVRLAQKRGMEGTKGGWKEFLKSHDTKFGASLSDPRRRSVDVLGAFLKTFTKKDDVKFFEKILQYHSNREAIEKLNKKSPDDESAEQRLVRLTLQHPQYISDYSFPSHEEDWIITKLSKKAKSMRSNEMVAVDCEMVLCEDGTEALVRVCVVDRNLEVKLNEFVNPNKAVVDYRSAITGISAKDLEGVKCLLADVQRSMAKLLSRGTILVGHSLNNDLQALKLDHARVIDTSYIFRYTDDPFYRKPSLNNLCKSVLGYEVRKNDAPHNCLDDACAAMKLVQAKIKSGVDTPIPLVRVDVPEIEMTRLLLHRIPVNVPIEELSSVLSGDFTINRQVSKKAGGDKYSALAIFKSSKEAHQAYENIKSDQEKDSFGRPQKFISFKLSTGAAASLLVRKIACSTPTDQELSKKRSLEVEESSVECKKLKTDKIIEEDEEKIAEPNQCCDHVKEIEQLKEVISQRESEITVLHKIISNLTRKQGL